MSTELSQYIEYLLKRRGEVSLPGIGSIALVQKSAYFTQGKTKLHPPKLTYEYSSEDSSSTELVDLLVQSEQYSQKEAEKTIKSYAQKILNNCLNYESALIPGVGYLIRKDNSFDFIPKETSLLKSLSGLQPLTVDPIRSKKDDLTPSPPIIVEKSTDWITYLGALLLGAFMIITYHSLVDPLGNNNQANLAEHTKIEKPASELQQKKNSSSDQNNATDNEPIDLKLLVPNNQDSVAKQDNLRSTSELGIIQTPRPNPAAINRGRDSSGVSIAKPKQDQKCIILVGVYTRPIEALVMVDRIKAKGFEPYRDVKFEANRVGVQFNCAEQDLEKMLKKVKSAINKEAYYLQPKITI